MFEKNWEGDGGAKGICTSQNAFGEGGSFRYGLGRALNDPPPPKGRIGMNVHHQTTGAGGVTPSPGPPPPRPK